MWVRKIYQERKQKGEFHLLINEMRLHDHELFFRYFRMSPTRYEHLLEQIGHAITKSSIKREPIGPSERLSVTLRYVFTGDSQVTLASSFRISPTSIGRIIFETTEAILNVLSPDYLTCPYAEKQWRPRHLRCSYMLVGCSARIGCFANCSSGLQPQLADLHNSDSELNLNLLCCCNYLSIPDSDLHY